MEIQTTVGIFLVSLGSVAMLLCLREMMLAVRSKRWQQVEGVFREVDLEPDDGDQGRYHATVTYAYRINGQEFCASRLRFGSVSSFGEKADAQLHLEHLRIGHPCTVYVDPAQPARAVLLPGLTGGSFVPPIVPCILIGMGVQALLQISS
ncbi:DUF3592 domain-containing protein [Massilia sp. CF038]|uniref:DUF3592 domain-containing protein n=1 Tax=Massilia sp. CF038 TaxID=1881045 RepID=UPI00092110BC|nr:DUF3592 domain-containing protein [Massilia sp. CF038]SHH70245.1 Protein of unknown function [Massilia sp. CF038]